MFIEIFPARQNVGVNIVTPRRVMQEKAAKLVATGLWSYQPMPQDQDDINLLVNKAKEEIKFDVQNNQIERERLKKEREELEVLRAELLAVKNSKTSKTAV